MAAPGVSNHTSPISPGGSSAWFSSQMWTVQNLGRPTEPGWASHSCESIMVEPTFSEPA